MENEKVVELLVAMQGSISDMQKNIVNMQRNMTEMQKEMRDGFKELRTDIKELKEGQERIEKRLDAVVEQTKDLTEFRTETMENFKDLRNTVFRVEENTAQKLYGYSPDFEARGLSGFSGYMVLGYEKLNLFILESIYPDNATYVFDKDWMELSKLTKAEILNNNFQKARLIHADTWNKSVESLLA
jgi:soluble cytochrome b562